MTDLVAVVTVALGASLFVALAERHSLWAGLTALFGVVVVGSLLTGPEPLRWSVAKIGGFALVVGTAWLARRIRRRRTDERTTEETTDRSADRATR